MNSDTQELEAIHMSVQTAELNLISFNADERINLSCGLMNIGRGTCSVNITPKLNQFGSAKGSLNIEISRPFMTADIQLGEKAFSKISKLLFKGVSRPVTLIILLDRSLNVNVKGDLLINKETKRLIKDISWVLPIR